LADLLLQPPAARHSFIEQVGTTSDRNDGAGTMKFFFAIFWMIGAAAIVAPTQAEINGHAGTQSSFP